MKTIDEALDAFLEEQDERLSERTFRTYREVIELFRRCMNDYGHSSLSTFESKRWKKAYEAGDDDAFTHLFGPEKIPAEVGQFLGWFIIRKVMAGQELSRACGTVTKKLGKWLEVNGLIDGGAATDMVERGTDATDVLPKAERLADLLYAETRTLAPEAIRSVPEEDWMEDQLLIERVEPGVLWFEGGLGPIEVPKKATDLARPGWMVTVSLARIGGRWRIAEVGNVYP